MCVCAGCKDGGRGGKRLREGGGARINVGKTCAHSCGDDALNTIFSQGSSMYRPVHKSHMKVMRCRSSGRFLRASCAGARGDALLMPR